MAEGGALSPTFKIAQDRSIAETNGHQELRAKTAIALRASHAR
jgi:hypothetical protein